MIQDLELSSFQWNIHQFFHFVTRKTAQENESILWFLVKNESNPKPQTSKNLRELPPSEGRSFFEFWDNEPLASWIRKNELKLQAYGLGTAKIWEVLGSPGKSWEILGSSKAKKN